MFIKIRFGEDFYLIKSQRINTFQKLIETAEKRWVNQLPNCYNFVHQQSKKVVGEEHQLDTLKQSKQSFENLIITKCEHQPILSETISKYRSLTVSNQLRQKEQERKMAKFNSSQNKAKNRQKQIKQKIASQQKVIVEQQQQINFSFQRIIKCNQCPNDIIGVRFKCKLCSNYNLCQNCEGNNSTHFHKFDRIELMPPKKQQQKKEQKQQIQQEKIMQRKDQQNQEQVKIKWSENILKTQQLALIIKIQIDVCLTLVQKCPDLNVEQLVNLYYYFKDNYSDKA